MLRVSYSRQALLNNNQLKAAVGNVVTMVAVEATVVVAMDLASVTATTIAVMTATAMVTLTVIAGDNDHAESIMLSAGGAESIIVSAPSLKS
jgi:hypothetical protein